jgi:hypothetical protein
MKGFTTITHQFGAGNTRNWVRWRTNESHCTVIVQIGASRTNLGRKGNRENPGKPTATTHQEGRPAAWRVPTTRRHPQPPLVRKPGRSSIPLTLPEVYVPFDQGSSDAERGAGGLRR